MTRGLQGQYGEDLRGAQARFPARPPERRHGLRRAIHADDDPPDTGLYCHDDPYQFATSDPPGRPATAFLSGFLQPLLTVSDPRPGDGLLTRGANRFYGAARLPGARDYRTVIGHLSEMGHVTVLPHE